LESEQTFRCLNGKQRAMLYLLALRTGLRRKELRSLTPESFDFSSKVSSVALHASNSKRRKQDRLPLPKDVATFFQEYIAELEPNRPVWSGSWWRKSAEMIRRDLTEAGLPVKDELGRIFDFHGQRTTFITGLSRAGVHPALAQKLARHSDIKLTMGTYTSMDLDELGSAVESLPGLVPSEVKQSEMNPDVSANEQLSKIQDVWERLSLDIRTQIISIVEKAVDSGT